MAKNGLKEITSRKQGNKFMESNGLPFGISEASFLIPNHKLKAKNKFDETEPTDGQV